MNVWDLLEETRGAPQPSWHTAFNTYPHGASQPVVADVAQCMGLGVVSFNCAMPQSMLQCESRWEHDHLPRFRDMLQSLGAAAGNDLVFCSGVGDARKGFGASKVDYNYAVQEGLTGVNYSTEGAHLHIWNVRNHATAHVQSGFWSATSEHAVDMFWQAYELTYRVASQPAHRDVVQLAGGKVGLLVGNMRIPTGGSSRASSATKRNIVEQALNKLADIHVEAWAKRQEFPVVRLLVGDCNLEKPDAEAVTQSPKLPPLTALQHELDVRKWQVREVWFLDRAWYPHTGRLQRTCQREARQTQPR